MDDAFSEEGSAQPRHDAQRPALAPRSDGFDIHTYHPDFVADPYPLLRLIRSRAPVCRDQASIWWISRYADVSACLRDRRFSADPARLGAAGVRQGGASWFGHQQLQPLARFYDNFMLFNDAPRHTRLRRLFAPAFGPDAVRRWEARIEVLVEELGLDLAASHGDAGQINRSAAAFSDYLQRQARGWSDGSSRPPSGAAPSILDGAAMLEAGLGLEDLVAAYAMVFMAAFETTISMVGNATLALLTHPDQLDLLRRCPELAANAVEELLRFDGAVRGGVRCTLEEVEIGGQRIPPGEKVWLSFLAANRDPEMFAAPDRLQLQRANAKQHVAFAHGPHYCLGAYLARLELQCALRGLVRRRFALASEPTDLRWRRSSVFRTLERLPIVPEGDAQKTCE